MGEEFIEADKPRGPLQPPATCISRPRAAIRLADVKLRCGPSKRPNVHRAAFWEGEGPHSETKLLFNVLSTTSAAQMPSGKTAAYCWTPRTYDMSFMGLLTTTQEYCIKRPWSKFFEST